VLIPEEIIAFLATGPALMLGTADAGLVPATARVMGTHASPDRTRLTVYVPAVQADESLANLRANPRLALVAGRPSDYRALQIKGVFESARPSDDDDRARQQRYHDAFAEQLRTVYVPAPVTIRLGFWPSVAITMRPTEIFSQTPGVEAGRPLP